MSLSFVRRLAADILKVGENRIWIDPERVDRASTVISREEVKRLIRDGVIKKRLSGKASRGRTRKRMEQKRKGRRRGPGTRRSSHVNEKKLWMNRIRAQRKSLRNLRDRRLVDKRTYRKLYSLAKGGYFRSVSHMRDYLTDRDLIKRGL